MSTRCVFRRQSVVGDEATFSMKMALASCTTLLHLPVSFAKVGLSLTGDRSTVAPQD